MKYGLSGRDQHLEIRCRCGMTLRARVAEWGSIPETKCPSCGRSYAVGVNVDPMTELSGDGDDEEDET